MALYRINGLHFRAWVGLGDGPSGEGECDAQERGAPVGNVPSGEGECETHG